eukprot:CAMPEP_0174258294 /NCGR_PEP_ID=MMETSP0439-20130205/7309_1 /TAXON_ID=0 /ORGANISM="Stereomyxa ramosa, Strain Chinc5" /LENGTH=490 /DNA_ID=CAMNT_0015341749 /DNA_START=1335 /DNA_END=2807 /DNA_ORIENTATION=+
MSETKPRWGGAPSDKCVKCEKTVYPAEKVVMEGQIWHIECLRCIECNKKIGGSNWGGFVPPDNHPYCKPCYRKLVQAAGGSVAISGSTTEWKPKTEEEKASSSNPLASRFGSSATDVCVGCGKKCYIAEKVVMEGQDWHIECLRCCECNKKLGGNNWGGFVPPDNKPYCKPCYNKLVQAAGGSVAISGSDLGGSSGKKSNSNPLASKFGGNAELCVKCGKRCYQAEKVVMEQRIFHIECLRCKECNKKLSGNNWGGFVPPDDDPYCKPCYTRMVQAAGSSVAISGSTAQWTPKEDSEKKSNPLASRFGGNAERCVTCGKRCYIAEKVVMEGKIFHIECLRCKDCNKKVGGNNWGGFVEDEPMCKPCYNKLVMAAGGSVEFSGSTSSTWKKDEKKKSNPLASRFGGGATDPCTGCGKKVYMAEKVTLEGTIWHQKCLRCKSCSRQVSGANFGGFVPPDNDLYCKVHYQQLVAALGDATKISGSTTGSKWNE